MSGTLSSASITSALSCSLDRDVVVATGNEDRGCDGVDRGGVVVAGVVDGDRVEVGGVVVGVGVEDLVVGVGVGMVVGVVEVGRVEISEIVEIVEIRVEVVVGRGGVGTEVEEYRQGLLCAISACANKDIRGGTEYTTYPTVQHHSVPGTQYSPYRQ